MAKGRTSPKTARKIDGSMLDSKKAGNGKLWKLKDPHPSVGVVDPFAGRHHVMKIHHCRAVGNLHLPENSLFCEAWGR